jgi:ABC-type antimicrobial peptide transport system permease subunit
MRQAILGGIAGCVLAAGVSKMLASSLVMINTFDVVAFAGAVLFVWLACAAAAYLPAQRVARIDPIVTLRYD